MRKSLAITVAFLLILNNIAFAVPSIPNRIYGNVNYLDGPAPDGTVIDAKIDGVTVASITAIGGKYGYAPNVFDIPDPGNTHAGKTISFFVNGVDTGETAVFAKGKVTELDLTVDGRINKNTGTNRIITSSFTGNVGNEAHSANASNDKCLSNWFCKDWSPCSNRTQTRSCVDVNNCTTSNNKPSLSQSCIPSTLTQIRNVTPVPETVAGAQKEISQSDAPTGHLLSAMSNGFGFVAAVIFVIGATIWYARKN